MLLFVSHFMRAQDVIVLKSGDEIQAKIVQVTDNDVSYKKFDYQDGPTFVVSKDKIFMIKYADGTKDVFSTSTTQAATVRKDTAYGQNILSFNPFTFIGGNLSLSFEHLNRSGKIGWRVPIYVPVIASTGNVLGAALDMKFYVPKNKPVSYYLGPSVTGFQNYDHYAVVGLMFVNGVSFMPANKFNVAIDLGAGMGREAGQRNTRAFLNTFIWRAGLTFGIRF